MRKMSIRKFRQMIYANHFNKEYLELEFKKKELENRVEKCLREIKFEDAEKLLEELRPIIDKLTKMQ